MFYARVMQSETNHDVSSTGHRSRIFLVGMVGLTLLVLGGTFDAAAAATIPVKDGCTLIDAIESANTDTAVGLCVKGDGNDNVRLVGNEVLTAVDNSDFGAPTGLPVITSFIRFRGEGFTLSRDGAAPAFSLFVVGPAGELTIEDATLSNGSSGFGAAVLNLGGIVTVTNSTISGNTVTDDGGGFYTNNGGTVSIVDSTISGNTATGKGGGLFADAGSTVTITNSTFSGNDAGEGGAIFGQVTTGVTTVTLTQTTLSGNTADPGAARSIPRSSTSVLSTSLSAARSSPTARLTTVPRRSSTAAPTWRTTRPAEPFPIP